MKNEVGKIKLPETKRFPPSTSFLNSEAFVFPLTPTKLPAMFCVCVEMKANLILAARRQRTEATLIFYPPTADSPKGSATRC